MSGIGRIVGRGATGLIAFLILVVLWLGATVASASPDATRLSMSKTVVCDTAEEVSAFVSGDPHEQVDAALVRVNGQFGKGACNVATTLFIKDAEAKTIFIQSGIVHILKVEIYGVVNDGALIPLIHHPTQYAPLFEKATSV